MTIKKEYVKATQDKRERRVRAPGGQSSYHGRRRRRPICTQQYTCLLPHQAHHIVRAGMNRSARDIVSLVRFVAFAQVLVVPHVF